MKKTTKKPSSSVKSKRLVLFDIDGTLVKSIKRVGHFQYAFRKIFNKEIEVDWTTFAGNVDRRILIQISFANGIAEDVIRARMDEAFDIMGKHFVDTVSPVFNEYFQPIAHAHTLVKHLSSLLHVGLLTGNVETIGRTKMKGFGLDKYLQFGLFGHTAETRNELAQQVFVKARDYFGIDFAPENIYIIGDTSFDVVCARAIAARSIAVSTGRHTYEKLKEANADLTVETLSDERVLPFILNS